MTEQAEIVIPSSPEDRKKIKDAFQEISNAKLRQAAERDYIKESISALNEQFGIPKAALRKMANAFHANSFDKISAEAEFIEEARDLLNL